MRNFTGIRGETVWTGLPAHFPDVLYSVGASIVSALVTTELI